MDCIRNEFIKINLQQDKLNANSNFKLHKNNSSNSTSSDENEDNKGDKELRYEGYIFKLTKTSKKLQKIYFKLVHKDLFYYKNKEDQLHAGLHNLSGVFIKEEPKFEFEGKFYFSLSINYGEDFKNYYFDNENDYKIWMKYLIKATDTSCLTDIYEIKVFIV